MASYRLRNKEKQSKIDCVSAPKLHLSFGTMPQGKMAL
jgi:hypothetical protein